MAWAGVQFKMSSEIAAWLSGVEIRVACSKSPSETRPWSAWLCSAGMVVRLVAMVV